MNFNEFSVALICIFEFSLNNFTDKTEKQINKRERMIFVWFLFFDSKENLKRRKKNTLYPSPFAFACVLFQFAWMR